MRSPDILQRFIACVQSNADAQAIEYFYAEHASMQENQAAPQRPTT